jgi:hypothetical protein
MQATWRRRFCGLFEGVKLVRLFFASAFLKKNESRFTALTTNCVIIIITRGGVLLFVIKEKPAELAFLAGFLCVTI